MATVQKVDRGARTVARKVTVDAPVDELFAQVADPHRHGELDGSGTVQDKVSGPTAVSTGDRFSVAMKQYGVPYKITSRVTEVVATGDHRVVEWQHPMGHRWRWELVSTGPETTEVTESFRYDTAKAPKVLELLKMPAQNAKGIERTLDKLAGRYRR